MSVSTVSDVSLPRQLTRPFFVVFRVLTIVYVLLVVAAAIMSWAPALRHVRDVLLLTAIMGGAMWVGLAISAFANWQSLTVLDDHLLFISFGKKSKVLYKDVTSVNVQKGGGESVRQIPTLTLFLHHQSEAENPLVVNLKLFAARDRVLLVELLKGNAPDAEFSDVAQEMLQKK